MKYNLKFSAGRCRCGNDISKEISKFLNNLPTIYNNCEYDDDYDCVICNKCGREYFILTRNMSVDIYKHEIEMEYCAICNELTRIDDMNECPPGPGGIINYICDDCESNYP